MRQLYYTGWRYLLACLLAVILLSGCGLWNGNSEQQDNREETSSPGSARPSQQRLEQPPRRGRADLNETLRSIASRYQGTVGIVVKHLGTGETATFNADQPFRAASLYKLFALYAAYAALEAGGLDLEDTLTLRPEIVDRDLGLEWRVGTRTSVSCGLRAMIAISNNAATEMVIDRLGGRSRVNALMRDIGVQQIGARNGYSYTSPADIALVLERIATKQAVSTEASDAMLGLLEDQRRNDRLPLPLPLGVRVAHKTGELTGLRNDAGIVYSRSGPYIFVAMADEARGDAPARQVILELSRAVYAHFEPDGLADYLGLPPRLAQEVFRTPDAKGRLAPLEDEWSQTVSASPAGVNLAQGVKNVQLREMVVPDLLAMQRAATAAEAGFWVTAGYRAPRSSDAALVDSDATALSCRVEHPPAKTQTTGSTGEATPPKPASAPVASQHWLGTVVAVSDSPEGDPAASSYVGSAAGNWLARHAWEYGFVYAPAESPQGIALGYEPWKLRWVGREMSARLHAMGYERDPSAVVTAELRKASRDLGAAASAALAGAP